MSLHIHIICGPTASGKSARALGIAQAGRGVIINADAMQVYAELHVLTARPSAEDERQAPHMLYGVLPASEACSAARWLEMAQEAIKTTAQNGQLPVVTGGTGLYLKALMEGLSPIPDIPGEVRQQATTLYNERGAEALLAHDPVMAARLKPGDTQRHIRALEVIISTGKSLAYWQDIPRVLPFPDAQFNVEQITLPREELYRRCDTRFLTMLEQGAIEEVSALLAQNLSDDLPAMRAVGVPELAAFLRGSITLQEATTQAQQATRNYAKRQLTWFRNQLDSKA